MNLDLNMPILVVDDYATMVKIIRNLLTQIGFTNIDDAHNGSAALAKIKAKTYGLVLSDWNMDEMTGIELLAQVRADPANAKLPFIMVTAESKADNIVMARQYGVDNYLVKPFTKEALAAKIKQIFASAQAA